VIFRSGASELIVRAVVMLQPNAGIV